MYQAISNKLSEIYISFWALYARLFDGQLWAKMTAAYNSFWTKMTTAYNIFWTKMMAAYQRFWRSLETKQKNE